MIRGRSGFGWLDFILGLLLVLLGVLTFVYPDVALGSLVFLYGAAAVFLGILDILLYVRVERYTGFGPVLSMVSGILSVMTGVMLLVHPTAGKWVLSLLFPIWFLAHCINRLAHLNGIRRLAGPVNYWVTLILNVLGLILGVCMVFSPMMSMLYISWIIGAYLLLLGADCIAMAFGGMGSRF